MEQTLNSQQASKAKAGAIIQAAEERRVNLLHSVPDVAKQRIQSKKAGYDKQLDDLSIQLRKENSAREEAIVAQTKTTIEVNNAAYEQKMDQIVDLLYKKVVEIVPPTIRGTD